MTRKTLSPKAKKALIWRLLEHYRVALGLGDWEVAVEFYRTRTDISPDPEEQCAAGCAADPEYRKMSLSFTLDELPAADLPATVIHELSHALVSDQIVLIDFLMAREADPAQRTLLKKMAHDANERSATALDRVFQAVLPPLPPA